MSENSDNKENVLEMLNAISNKKPTCSFWKSGPKPIYLRMLEYDPDSFTLCGDGTVTSKYFKDGIVLECKSSSNDNIEIYDYAFRNSLFSNMILNDQYGWFGFDKVDCSPEFLYALIDIHYYYSIDNPIKSKIRAALNNYITTAPTYGLEWDDKIIDKVEKNIYRTVRGNILRTLGPGLFTGLPDMFSYEHCVKEFFGVTDPEVLDIIVRGLYYRYGNDRYKQQHKAEHRRDVYKWRQKPKYEYHTYDKIYDRSLSWVLSTEGFYHKVFSRCFPITLVENESGVGLYKSDGPCTLSTMVGIHFKWSAINEDFYLELYNKLSLIEDSVIIRNEDVNWNYWFPSAKEYSEPRLFVYFPFKREEWVRKTNNWLNAIKPGGIVEQLADTLPFDARLFLETVRHCIDTSDFDSSIYLGVKDPNIALAIRLCWVQYCDGNHYDSDYFSFKPARIAKW